MMTGFHTETGLKHRKMDKLANFVALLKFFNRLSHCFIPKEVAFRKAMRFMKYKMEIRRGLRSS